MTLQIVLGIPGLMSTWGIHALKVIADEAFDDYNYASVETLDDMRNAWTGRSSQNVILSSLYPDADLCAFLCRSKTPYMIFSESALDSITHLIHQFAKEDIALVRSLSASIACISQMHPHPFLVHLDRSKIGDVRIHRVIAQMCRQLGVSLTPAGMIRCLEQLGMDSTGSTTQTGHIPTLEESAAKISPPCEDQPDKLEGLLTIARHAIEPFDGKILKGQVSSLTWPQESFLLADKGGETAIGAIELVGKARCLVYGPYFHLPAGRWNARFFLDIDENIYGQIFTIEVFSEDILGKIRILPSGTGSFAAETTFRIERPKAPIEIRLFTETGSIEGAIAHWHVELRPIDNEIIAPDDSQFESGSEPDRDAPAMEQEFVNHQN
ncbi:hypothetical protein [Phyllobacterium myrsinacearum]|nr:hypothetical protein [Phyllobacterium myrsinacearum]PWV89186.1 hypothetical protein DEV92_10950 [Phyllobacterium myrsinacearum]RZV05577.1 hypothetical protein EV654_3023 [Phyllobacterium myrsinacearum]